MDHCRKKLLYRASHRGIKEMDLILTAFCAAELEGLDQIELDQFEALLDVADLDLYFWITGAEETPVEHRSDLLNRLKALPPVAGARKT